MPTGLRAPLSPSSAPPSVARVVPPLFMLGWLLLAGAEVLGTPGAPAVPACMAVVAGVVFGADVGFWAGLLVGLAADLLSGLPLGVQAAAGASVGAVVGSMSTAVSPGSWMAPTFFLVIAGVGYRVIVGAVAALGAASAAPCTADLPRLAAWDAVLGLAIYLVVSRWAPGRR